MFSDMIKRDEKNGRFTKEVNWRDNELSVARALCGLKMRDAAKVLGCSLAYISKLEGPRDGLTKLQLLVRSEMAERLTGIYKTMREIAAGGTREDLKELLAEKVGDAAENKALVWRLEVMALEGGKS